MAQARPDLFHAYVGTGQVGEMREDHRVAYEMAIQTAQRAHDARAVAALRALGPPPYADGKGWQLLYRWRRACEGPDTDIFLKGLMGLALSAPGYSIRDVNDWIDGQILFRKVSVRARPQATQHPFCAAGVCLPGRPRLHHPHRGCAAVRQVDCRAAQGLRGPSRRGTLRGLFEIGRFPRGAPRKGQAAGRRRIRPLSSAQVGRRTCTVRKRQPSRCVSGVSIRCAGPASALGTSDS